MRADTRKQLEILKAGNPPDKNAGIFGASICDEDASIVLLPVPFDLTTSYGRGTAKGPRAIVEASHQLDLYDQAFEKPYMVGIKMLDEDESIRGINKSCLASANRVIAAMEGEGELSDVDLAIVNEASTSVNDKVCEISRKYLNLDKVVALVGGDHSTPLGLMKALSEKYDDYGVLHLDAHHDLRIAYEGFTYSHASIMYNAINEIPQISKLISIAIRDYCEDEMNIAESSDKVETFYDREIKNRLFEGETWKSIVDEIISKLPENVYLSFDIDGLDPFNCPTTGTPVAGGLSVDQVYYMLEKLALSGKKIISFDLTEVAPNPDNEWDANVGARMLYKMCGALVKSQSLKYLGDI